MKNRYLEIDLLRGIAILAMILIHTTYYFLSDATALFIWKWSQFAVPVFIFCSAYLFFQKPQGLSLRYLKKRFTRLVYPYYIFLLLFIPVIYFITPAKITFDYILQSIFLIGGVDINWLILLFVFLTLIFPLLYIFSKKYQLLSIIFSAGSIISSFIFIFIKFPFSYKFIFWLPWSIIPLFAMFFVRKEQDKNFINYATIASGLLFIASYYLEKTLNHNLGMYENKYPPTIYFLSYGVFMILVIYLLSKYLQKSKIITKILSFFSIYSYSIFFIHYTILIILASQIKYFHSWIPFFLSVLGITIAIQMLINTQRKTT